MNLPIIYIAGAISGKPNLNREAFAEAANFLRRKGFIVRNPHEFCKDISSSDSADPEYYRRGFQILSSECTDILLLDGWEDSAGARIEFNVASLCGYRIHTSLDELVEFFKKEIGG